MMDWRGQVAEATGANAFFIRDGVIHTPTPDCFLNGITRQTLIDLAQQARHRGAGAAIWPEELESFEQLLPDRLGGRSDLCPVGRPVELRDRRPPAAAGAGLRRSGERRQA
jgi:branched-chain amino acid aminotransferase